MFRFSGLCAISFTLLGCAHIPSNSAAKNTLDQINHIVVIYAENRSFDNLYGEFPNADGIASASLESKTQLDVNGTVLPRLPPVWKDQGKCETVNCQPKQDSSYPEAMPNQPFKINELGAGHMLSDKTRDLVHRFYQNQEQINGGMNNRFAAVSDAGALTMGYYDGSSLPMWKLAQQYTLADHFFMGAFGGSFLNHMYLVCACAPKFESAQDSMRIILDKQGHLLRAETSPKTALDGPPQYFIKVDKEHPENNQIADNVVTSDGYAVNTTQSSYQPSGIAPANINSAAYADINKNPLPPQTIRTIGDALTEKNVSWKWYSEGWDFALKDGMQAADQPRRVIYSKTEGAINFQAHHQPFNYFKNFAPESTERAAHLADGSEFIQSINNGVLPEVAFYKPSGANNEHPGYADILSGDQHIADLVTKIQAGPQWSSTLIIVTYDENGGFWDHVAPPKGDRWGPGTRIPTIIISPFAKKGFVDHTVYDTGSIIKLITKRFNLRAIEGVRPAVGDLTNALDLN